MRRMTLPWALFAVLGLLIAVALLGGCNEKPDTVGAQAGVPTSAPGAPPSAETGGKVRIHAYINVRNGCQAPTVDLLDKLVKENAQYVDYTITDFGSPEGSREWIDSGLNCMAIQFNDSTTVVLPSDGGQLRLMIFELPVGQGMWTHDDLREVFDTIRKGSFRVATQQERDEFLAPSRLDMRVLAQQASDLDGPTRTYGQVLFNDQVVLTFLHSAAGKSPSARAKQAGKALGEWISGKVLPNDIQVEETDNGFRVIANDLEVAQVIDADAKDYNIPTQVLAGKWAGSIQHVVMVARAKQKLQEAKTQAPDAGVAGQAPSPSTTP